MNVINDSKKERPIPHCFGEADVGDVFRNIGHEDFYIKIAPTLGLDPVNRSVEPFNQDERIVICEADLIVKEEVPPLPTMKFAGVKEEIAIGDYFRVGKYCGHCVKKDDTYCYMRVRHID